MPLRVSQTYPRSLTLVQAPSKINREAVLKSAFPAFEAMAAELFLLRKQIGKLTVRPSSKQIRQIKRKPIPKTKFSEAEVGVL